MISTDKNVRSRLTREQHKVNNIIALQRQNDVIAMELEGKSGNDIKTYLMGKYKITAPVSGIIMAAARKAIAERKNYEVDNLITMHIARYELIYSKLYELRAFINATRALQAKEKLMGFHKEGFHMRVTQGEISALSLQQVNDEYDVMKLSEIERDKFNLLIRKMESRQVAEKV